VQRSLTFLSLVSLALVAPLGGCGKKSLVGQPCQTAGDTQCDKNGNPDTLVRCDGTFYVPLADCANQCIAAKPPVQHTQQTIDADETWACADGPHEIGAPILVSPNVTLTIESGAMVILQPAAHLDTDPAGRVVAVADANAPILFTSVNKQKGGYGSDSAGGLNIFAVEGAPSQDKLSDIENVILERGVQGLGVLGLSSTATPPIVKDNTLRDNLNFGIIVSCNDAGAQIPDFHGDGNQFFGNGGEISACGQELPGGEGEGEGGEGEGEGEGGEGEGEGGQ
jgi:hypothetical protein